MPDVHVLYIDGKMYGFHLGTSRREARAIVEEKAPYFEGSVFTLHQGQKLVATYFDGQWAPCH